MTEKRAKELVVLIANEIYIHCMTNEITYYKVAKDSGLSTGTVKAIFQSEINNPMKLTTLLRVVDSLDGLVLSDILKKFDL